MNSKDRYELKKHLKAAGARIKVTGAQWNIENLSNVLKQRCAYLNSYVV
jgi:hypothetical protein